MIVLLRRQMDFCSIVAAQSLSRLFWPVLGYCSSFSKKPPSERQPAPLANRPQPGAAYSRQRPGARLDGRGRGASLWRSLLTACSGDDSPEQAQEVVVADLS